MSEAIETSGDLRSNLGKYVGQATRRQLVAQWEDEEIHRAERIEAYWRDRGYRLVCCTVEHFDRGNQMSVFGVRSNLVNGLPAGYVKNG